MRARLAELGRVEVALEALGLALEQLLAQPRALGLGDRVGAPLVHVVVLLGERRVPLREIAELRRTSATSCRDFCTARRVAASRSRARFSSCALESVDAPPGLASGASAVAPSGSAPSGRASDCGAAPRRARR